jgi:hypothetical protein
MLIQCRDCGHTISRAAHACPQCGRPTGRAPRQRGIFSTTFGVLLSLFFIIFILPWMCCATPFILPLVAPDPRGAYISGDGSPPQENRPTERVKREPWIEPVPEESLYSPCNEWVVFDGGHLAIKVEPRVLHPCWREASGRTGAASQEALTIYASIENRSEFTKYDYSTWQDGSAFSFRRSRPAAVDSMGNSYSRINLSYGDSLCGADGTGSVYPGDTRSDILIFEPPIEKYGAIILTLPLQYIGLEGEAEFEITAECFPDYVHVVESDPVVDLVQAVGNEKEPVPAEPIAVVDPYASCREWGKDDDYIDKIYVKYLDGRRTVRKYKRIQGSRLSCSRRVSDVKDRTEIEQCMACLKAIIEEVYEFSSKP